MEQTLTLKCRLITSPEEDAKIEATLQAFSDACNYVNEIVPSKITSKATIQSQVYHDIRAKFGISANLAVRVCARVGASRKAAKKKGFEVKEFQPTSADYDARIFSFREKDWTVSLNLINERVRFNLDVGAYQKGKLTGKNPTSAVLCKQPDGYILHIQVDNEVPEPPKPKRALGCDVGRTDIAHLSTGESFSGGQVKKIRDHYAQLRARLQQKASKGTRSSRRRCRQLLKRLSGKEKRFQKWVNHTVSFRIVKTAIEMNAVIVLEDLTGIRERTNRKPRSKTERRRSNSWACYQLRQFIVYKSLRDGANYYLTNPAYTSQTHHKCLRIGVRNGKVFYCPGCDERHDADWNASMVLELIGLSVTQPGGSRLLSCELSYDTLGLLKQSPMLCVGESPRASAGG